MEKFIAGIDEAGRGPLIGPLVICAAAMPEDKEHELKALGVKDSKLLTEEQRERILKHLIKLVHFEYIIIQPAEIDAALANPDTNLNWLEADHGAALLNKLQVKLQENISKCIIDCPSTNLVAFTKYLQEKVDDKDIKLMCEHKADFHHLIVGAASIFAKVTREQELERLKKRYHIEFGSGYPSDPRTVAFVEENFANKEYAHIFRNSWETYRKICNRKSQSKLGEF